jgi:hypothetical protein
MHDFVFYNKFLFWKVPPGPLQQKFLRRCMVDVPGNPLSPEGFLYVQTYSF